MAIASISLSLSLSLSLNEVKSLFTTRIPTSQKYPLSSPNLQARAPTNSARTSSGHCVEKLCYTPALYFNSFRLLYFNLDYMRSKSKLYIHINVEH
jgi:hypothetical protein